MENAQGKVSVWESFSDTVNSQQPQAAAFGGNV
jgi:hypothetical protein